MKWIFQMFKEICRLIQITCANLQIPGDMSSDESPIHEYTVQSEEDCSPSVGHLCWISSFSELFARVDWCKHIKININLLLTSS